MRKQLLMFAALLSMAMSLHAQESEKLGWMAGTWTQNKDGETVQESWLGPKGKMMAAVNLTSSAKRTSFEFLRIVETAAGLVYLASPGGKTPVEFKLKEMADKRVVFENPTHDFPQRVMYWIEPDGAMTARVEGTIAGKLRGMQWRFELAK